MNLTFIGTGYVGLISGACFADIGNKVICLDIDKNKIKMLSKSIVPIYEPGIKELIKKGLSNKTLVFTTNKKKAIEESEVIFITVGTPQNEKGKANLEYVKEAANFIGQYLNECKVIVNKSTVPLGTAELVKEIITKKLKKRNKIIDFDVISNPEFLAEGNAINDFKTERVVIGSESEKAKQIMVSLYSKGFETEKKILTTDIKSAEITKYASNSMLALRLSFINEVSQLCEEVGANIDDVSKGIGLDPRIGPYFLKAGLGYGGSCFPKDIRAFENTMRENNCEPIIISQIEKLNKIQLLKTMNKAKRLVGNFKGKKICILGLAFKANTDDIRESPAIKISLELKNKGAILKAYDPKAMNNAKSILANTIFCNSAYEAINNCDLVIIATEWEEFKQLDRSKMISIMNKPNIVDGRNIFDPKEMKALGFNYLSIGKKQY